MARFEDVIRRADAVLNYEIAKLVYVGKLKPMVETSATALGGP